MKGIVYALLKNKVMNLLNEVVSTGSTKYEAICIFLMHNENVHIATIYSNWFNGTSLIR